MEKSKTDAINVTAPSASKVEKIKINATNATMEGARSTFFWQKKVHFLLKKSPFFNNKKTAFIYKKIPISASILPFKLTCGFQYYSRTCNTTIKVEWLTFDA